MAAQVPSRDRRMTPVVRWLVVAVPVVSGQVWVASIEAARVLFLCWATIPPSVPVLAGCQVVVLEWVGLPAHRAVRACTRPVNGSGTRSGTGNVATTSRRNGGYGASRTPHPPCCTENTGLPSMTMRTTTTSERSSRDPCHWTGVGRRRADPDPYDCADSISIGAWGTSTGAIVGVVDPTVGVGRCLGDH